LYFTHDPNQNFYYYGQYEPHSRMYKEYLADPKIIGIDVETISLKERIAIEVGISVQPLLSFYFPLFPEPSPVTPWHLLKDPAITKVFHNALFDLGCMREYEIDNSNIKDTSVMSHLLGFSSSRLVDLAPAVGMEVHAVPELLDKGQVMLDLEPSVVAKKCMQDSGATLALFYQLLPHIDISYFNTEMELIPILIDMSFRGLLIDQEARQKLEERLEAEVEYYLNLCEGEGFNPGSPQQVGYILAKREAYKVFYKLPFTKGRKGLDTSEEKLMKMDDPMATIVLGYREKSKLLSTYIRPWRNEDRAYTRFHLDAITGRVSSTERNMQNIPKGEPRGIFLPDSGIFTDWDFSQVELRTLAHVSGDREMQYVFESGGDIHQTTSDFMGILRGLAKNVNFAMIYGATDETIADTAKIRSIQRAKQLKEMWFAKYREAGDWIQTVQVEAFDNPWSETVFGRRIRLPDIEEEGADRIMRKAVNYPIQGSAAEILKRALILCKHLPMALQVHDEILVDGRFDIPKGLEEIAPFQTPVDTKYLDRWE